ncbi:MAG: RNase adapter RapZ [Candidatus Dadabacteria bacterium]|nr:MAG: RNase adapter RapZ [Candidatus Dadabacteria bacterium]
MSINFDHFKALVLLAGISGAGKSSALNVFSDRDFAVVDNLPVPLLEQFVLFTAGDSKRFERTALLLDINSRDKVKELLGFFKALGNRPYVLQIVFLDCETQTVLKRYSETRRPHPGFDSLRDKTLADTVQRERNRLIPIKEMANLVVDTSNFTVHDLKRELNSFIDSLPSAKARTVRVNFLSFGFKYGAPLDCDLIVDVRFLPNPYFIEGLRDLTGKDRKVADYVLGFDDARSFIKRYTELLEFLLPRYIYEGKSYLNIGVGCTGGKHRSVTIAEELAKAVTHDQCVFSVKHRDIDR